MNIYSYICIMNTETHSISHEKLQEIAAILKVIGHPVRLEILQVLKEEEPLSVSELMNRVNIKVEQSLLSHHLIKMKDKGLLKSKKVGMHKLYQMSDRQILKIFACMEKCDF